MYEVTTIGDLGEASADEMAEMQIFEGAQHRTQIAAFMGALAYEKFTKGVAVGFVGGVVVMGFVGYLIGLRPTVKL